MTTSNRQYGKVAVLMGGRSAEREISLRSGTAVLEALLRSGVQAEAVDAGEAGFMQRLEQGAYARVFNALHGRGGEDGVIQGYLELLGMPYTGSGVLGSALGMDKLRCKQIWQGMGLPTPAFVTLHTREDLANAQQRLGFPMMIKPIHEGSSIGMSKVDQADQLPAAWEQARKLDDAVLAEQWITGREYTAAIVDAQALPLIRLETPNQFYDYAAKYEANTTRYHCPSGASEAEESQWQALALQAFAAVGAYGWGRVDFMVDAQGNAWLIEVNTVPGMTDHSLVPMAAKQAGMDFDALVLRILQTAQTRNEEAA